MNHLGVASCPTQHFHHLDPVLLQEHLGCNLLVERVSFDLVDSRRHLVMADHVHDPVGWKLLRPMARTRPSRYSSSIARQAPYTSP